MAFPEILQQLVCKRYIIKNPIELLRLTEISLYHAELSCPKAIEATTLLPIAELRISQDGFRK
jgi:hypothetical protein